ncbi:C40 family peptidase [Paenibacillus senegalensis]|uniref:C40 family peptidase n=1 Tax=Paenibacillus senegalensis TaxID=1465766 RepID=UPI000288A260|nr:SH3 domain-containing C40 family peptidase [Paenibacillus senegalensis]
MKKMTKGILSVVIAASIGFSSVPIQALASEQGTLKVVSSVNFREKPTTNGNNQIRFLKSGETLEIIGQPNSYWYQVKDKNGRTGYVSSSSKYVTRVSSGSSSNNSSSGSKSNASASTKVERVIKAGQKYLGTPYEFGSNRSSTRTFDCSDFVRRAFIEGAGITLPSDSRKQGDYVKKVGKTTTNWKNLKRGDLMFFMSYKGTSKSSYPSNKQSQRITHVSIYLGNGKMLHTYSNASGGVRVDSIANKHWEYRFMFGGSAL